MADNLFHICEGSFVITYRKGLEFQRQVFERSGRLYIKSGAGFASLTRNGTSLPDESVVEQSIEFQTGFDKLGRMIRGR